MSNINSLEINNCFIDILRVNMMGCDANYLLRRFLEFFLFSIPYLTSQPRVLRLS